MVAAAPAPAASGTPKPRSLLCTSPMYHVDCPVPLTLRRTHSTRGSWRPDGGGPSTGCAAAVSTKPTCVQACGTLPFVRLCSARVLLMASLLAFSLSWARSTDSVKVMASAMIDLPAPFLPRTAVKLE